MGSTHQRVFVAGATGYIGRYVARELARRGHEVVCFARRRSGIGGASNEDATRAALAETEVRFGDVTDAASVARDGFRTERFDAVVSCLATRTGGVDDAWRIEHRANLSVLDAGQRAGIERFVLLSAICVQRPRLEFQRAKLAFERALIEVDVSHVIVRPTAFFKSLSGQVEKVKAGGAFTVFGDGTLTACKPISERDLARFIADALDDPDLGDAILPVGGPGDPITPRGQAELLFELLGRAPKLRRVPLGVFDAIVGALGVAARIVPPLRDKAELARIGRYYATESMLVWDDANERYDAAATPSFGHDTLRAHYARVLVDGLGGQELGDHAMF